MIGTKLNNGATVIAQHGDVVLCHWREGKSFEFIVWNIDSEGNAFWGRYTDDLEVALELFKEKSCLST